MVTDIEFMRYCEKLADLYGNKYYNALELYKESKWKYLMVADLERQKPKSQHTNDFLNYRRKMKADYEKKAKNLEKVRKELLDYIQVLKNKRIYTKCKEKIPYFYESRLHLH